MGKQVEIDTRLITQAGTAKVQIENKMDITVSRTGKDGELWNPVSITFQKN